MIRVKHRKCTRNIRIGEEELDCLITYSGYADEGRSYGPPEHCYPPEDEINVEKIVSEVDGREIEFDSLPDLEADALVNHCEDDMAQAAKEYR